MCLIVFAHDVHPEYRLVLAANRDEFHARPTAPLDRWEDAPGLAGGRDLRSGGTWLAASVAGRWAAVTNFRDPAESGGKSTSRGHLVADFVREDGRPEPHLDALRARDADYDGYNLVVGTPDEVWWTSNRAPAAAAPRCLHPGIYGVSNHLLDTPWPKVTRAKRALRRVLADPDPPTPERLLDLLLDRAYAAEHELPDTGVPRDLERALSASFISLPEYGTRSSTALLIPRSGPVLIAERRYDAAGAPIGETALSLHD